MSAPPDEPANEDISSSLTNFAAEVAANGMAHTAPVTMPSREKLTVRLVNVELISRLDELRSDAAFHIGFAWAAVGLVTGIFTNIFTSESPLDRKTIVFSALAITIAIVFAFLAVRASRRARILKLQLMDDASQRP